MRTIFCLFLFAFFPIAHASTTIDFDSEPVGTADPLVIDGFRFEALSSIWTSQVIEESPGDNAYYLGVGGFFDVFGAAGPIFVRLSAADGSMFSLLDVDFFATNQAFGATAEPGIVGYMGGGSYASGSVGSADWLNLEYVDFGVSSCCGVPGGQPEFLQVTIDNVVVGAAIPIPAAVWLFGSGLGLLGWMKRKRA